MGRDDERGCVSESGSNIIGGETGESRAPYWRKELAAAPADWLHMGERRVSEIE